MHQKEKAVKPFTVIPYTEIVKDGFAVFLTLEFTIRYAEERKTGFFFLWCCVLQVKCTNYQ